MHLDDMVRAATSALAAGTPDETTFLRGDQTWSVPPNGGSLPAGLIAMWAGTLASIPVGWALCDGQNGTPDLRDRFVKGAAAGAQPGTTGGAGNHTHTYTDVISHTHTVNVNDSGHAHAQQVRSTGTAGTAGTQGASTANNVTVGTTGSAFTGITATTVAPAGSVATGTTASAGSEPPFYTLLFIQKQ